VHSTGLVACLRRAGRHRGRPWWARCHQEMRENRRRLPNDTSAKPCEQMRWPRRPRIITCARWSALASVRCASQFQFRMKRSVRGFGACTWLHLEVDRRARLERQRAVGKPVDLARQEAALGEPPIPAPAPSFRSHRRHLLRSASPTSFCLPRLRQARPRAPERGRAPARPQSTLKEKRFFRPREIPLEAALEC